MYYSKRKDVKGFEFFPRKCPCTRDLVNICWLQLVKRLKHHDGDHGDIEPGTVEFCPDNRSVMDERYPVHLADKTKMRGFGSICNAPSCINILEETYWFCRHKSEYGLVLHVKQLANSCLRGKGGSAKLFRDTIESILNTMNGLIIKKIIFLSRECVNYATLAKQTAALFRGLCIEYAALTRSALKEPCLYEEAKNYFQFIKENFAHDDLKRRQSIFYYKFKSPVLKDFFLTELLALNKYAAKHRMAGRGDYTTSLMWKFRMSHLAQTRTLDHLPYFMAREKISEFITLMTREVTYPSNDEMELVHRAVEKNLEDNCVKRGLYETEAFAITEGVFRESIEMDLHLTASLAHSVKQGGKLEDARLLLKMAKECEWRAPIRNLTTGEIIGLTPLVTGDSWNEKGMLNLSSVIFWLSLQIATNFLAIQGIIPEENNYVPMYDRMDDEWYDESLLHAKVIGIEELGKLRMLVKTNSVLNWSLSIGSKLLQKGLATHPDHRSGLEMGSQDWNFAKRLSGESEESRFLYNLEGRLRDDAHFGQTDWSEATNILVKLLGFQMMRTYMQYTHFPRWYGGIILELTRAPLSVKETAMVFDGEEVFVDLREHEFKEGFMMGVQTAKAYLHLSHIACDGLSTIYLEEKGFVIGRSRVDQRIPADALPASVESRVATKLW